MPGIPALAENGNDPIAEGIAHAAEDSKKIIDTVKDLK
jgi:hypothetical protein